MTLAQAVLEIFVHKPPLAIMRKTEKVDNSVIRVANHVTSDDRVHGISENKLLNSGNIFVGIFVNTCQN